MANCWIGAADAHYVLLPSPLFLTSAWAVCSHFAVRVWSRWVPWEFQQTKTETESTNGLNRCLDPCETLCNAPCWRRWSGWLSTINFRHEHDDPHWNGLLRRHERTGTLWPVNRANHSLTADYARLSGLLLKNARFLSGLSRRDVDVLPEDLLPGQFR